MNIILNWMIHILLLKPKLKKAFTGDITPLNKHWANSYHRTPLPQKHTITIPTHNLEPIYRSHAFLNRRGLLVPYADIDLAHYWFW